MFKENRISKILLNGVIINLIKQIQCENKKNLGILMQIDQSISLNYKTRTLDMKKRVISQPHEICIERARLFTESYKKTKGEHPKIRFAKAMDHLLKNMTIKIWDDEFIVGNRCNKIVGTPLYPEVRVDNN